MSVALLTRTSLALPRRLLIRAQPRNSKWVLLTQLSHYSCTSIFSFRRTDFFLLRHHLINHLCSWLSSSSEKIVFSGEEVRMYVDWRRDYRGFVLIEFQEVWWVLFVIQVRIMGCGFVLWSMSNDNSRKLFKWVFIKKLVLYKYT